MIGPYFDTGVALKLVVEEPLSPVVRGFVERRRIPVLFSRLVELEIECALQALLFRQIISGEQLAEARALVRQLVHRGQFRKVDLSLDKVATETLSLAPVCTAGTGCRTLDLMHVAAAKMLSCAEFVTTDQRQIAAARLCGLQAINLEDEVK